MFSGKTTELIRRLKRYQIAKYKCLIIKYACDDRYSASDIVSHDRQSLAAVSARKITDFGFKVLEYDVIGIDEGQFFPDIVERCEEFANLGKIVIIAALDGTFQRVGFGNILNLIPLAENVVKLNAVCMICFREASFTKRIGSETKASNVTIQSLC
ncbi:Thymidine kinase [Zootermopsis nevadensis]|uniref:Thymidine kinase n=1 Tax=Zootermopsis nevadensis TaxID=136037 RepID=A0A067QNC6_ZOONE|nr:Thymidine kinase [Zootermopsis nevadensis]